MENEIKVGNWIRDREGHITKIIQTLSLFKDVQLYLGEDGYQYSDNAIVKHSPNLIDLIECGDYVNGKEVIMDLQKSKEWYKSKDDFITCKDYTFEEDEIKTIVTKEMMESISYKVTKM